MLLSRGVTVQGAVALIYDRRVTIAKFLASGCTAATVEFSILFALTHHLGLHYLLSSALAFTVAVCVGFTLQKFWTFNDSSLTRIHKQAIQYVFLGATNLGINTLLMLALVEIFHIWYIFSQAIVCAILACSNFLLYNLFIFRQDTDGTN
ncbi:MAG: GtrA family protein [Syntrophobacteraceae bacterium]